MSSNKNTLEKYSGKNTRHACPDCGKREFSRYVSLETGEYIADHVGRCNREVNCGYHYTPRQYFADNNFSFDVNKVGSHLFTDAKPKSVTQLQKQTSFIPVDKFKASLRVHDTNHFIAYLTTLFDTETVKDLILCYLIGSSKHWNGSSIFWQIDLDGNIHTGKVIQYNPKTGKRVKEPFNHITWAHKLIEQNDFELRQCLFGEHLLVDTTKPVALVESEKTAIIASAYLPQFIWLAVGSLNGLNEKMCKVLRGRDVILYPDLKCYEKWKAKAKELSHIANFSVSELLEQNATDEERESGLDLADYLVRFQHKDFLKTEKPAEETSSLTPQESNEKERFRFHVPIGVGNGNVPEPETNWDRQITELESFFKGITLTDGSVKLNAYTTITSVPLFIESHLNVIKTNNGKRSFEPYLSRLQDLKTLMIQP